MKRVRLFDNESQFNAMKDEFLNPNEPHVAYTKDTRLVYMTPLEDIIYSEVYVSMVYTSVEDDKQSWFRAGGETIVPTLFYQLETLSSDGNQLIISGSTDNPYDGATITFSGEGVDPINGSVTAPSKGSDVSEKTFVTKATATVEINGVVGSVSVNLYQEPNYIVSTSYGAPGGLVLTVSTIPASGGTISEGDVLGSISQVRTDVYKSTSVVNTTLKKLTPTRSGYTEPISAPSLENTVTVKRQVGTMYIEFEVNGQVGRAWADVYQDPNYIITEQTTYGAPYGLSLATPNDIVAKGGTVSATAINGTCKQVKTEYFVANPSKGYETVLNNISYNGSFDPVTATNLHTTKKDRSYIDDLTYTYRTQYGNEATISVAVYQEANDIVSTKSGITYMDVTAGTISNKTIPASGGNATATASNGSQDVYSGTTYTWKTGENTYSDLLYYKTDSIAPTIKNLYGEADTRGSVSAASQSIVSSAITYWNGSDNKKVSSEMFVYQAPNNATSSTDYRVSVGTITNATIPANGGSATATAGKGYYTATTITTYDSGAAPQQVTTGHVNPDVSEFTATANTKGCVASDITEVGRKSVSWTYGGKMVTGVMIVSQAKNVKTLVTADTETSARVYGNITKGKITDAYIPAGGGQGTATAAVGTQPYTYTVTPYSSYTYSSGCVPEREYGSSTTYDGSVNVSPSVSSISGEAGSRGTVTGSLTTITSTTVTWSANGKSVSDTMYVYQQANTTSFIGYMQAQDGYESQIQGLEKNQNAWLVIRGYTLYASGMKTAEFDRDCTEFNWKAYSPLEMGSINIVNAEVWNRNTNTNTDGRINTARVEAVNKNDSNDAFGLDIGYR